MSLPTWAKMPVIGAMKPMRKSSARAFDGMASAAASVPPNNTAAREIPLFMFSLPKRRCRLPLRAHADASEA